MAYIGKVYNHDRDESFKEFVEALGVSAELADAVTKFKPTLKLEKDGSSYIMTTTDPRGEKVLKFESGVEFEQTVTDEHVANTTIIVEGDVVTQCQKFPDERFIITNREFTDSELVVTLKVSTWDGIARRYYKAS